MRLLIISHTPHYTRAHTIVGWGPTVQEIDYLATLFDEVTHIAPMHAEPAPVSALTYQSPNVHVVPVPPTGGRGIVAKSGILHIYPQYARVINHHLATADFVHVRCPANISLLAVLMLMPRHTPRYRWFKFAGNWKPPRRDAWSYVVQRLFLGRNWIRGMVSVNGHWDNQSSHIFSFLNPSLSIAEVNLARAATASKMLSTPLRLVFVGRLNIGKGLDTALRIVTQLIQAGERVQLDVIGDGPYRMEAEQLAEALHLRNVVHFQGWQSRSEIAPYYQAAHFILLPSTSEGWPKVLSEAMAYGAVPVTSYVSSIPKILADIGCGVALPPNDEMAFVSAIQAYVRNPDRWQREKQCGQVASENFTFERYGDTLAQAIRTYWGIDLIRQ